MTPVFYAIIAALVLYSASSLLLRVNWRQMYYRTPIRRPRLIVHVITLPIAIYAFLVFYAVAMPAHIILDLPTPLDMFAAYRGGEYT